MLPFVSKSQGESLEELFFFLPNQPIGGNNKRGEMPALFETGLQVLLLFIKLLCGKDLVEIMLPRRQLGICICHAGVNNGAGPMGPKAMDGMISPLYIA